MICKPTSNPRGITATAAVVDRRQRQQSTRLLRVLRSSCQPPQIRASDVGSERNRCCHGEHPAVRHGESHHPRVGEGLSQRSRALVLDPSGQLAAVAAEAAEAGLPVSIDEVQRLPQLTLALKRIVDKDRRPGQFVLTGSSDVFSMPRALDSLAGGVTTLTLRPLSAAEIRRQGPCHLLDSVWNKSAALNAALPSPAPYDRRDAIELIVRGGFPEIRPWMGWTAWNVTRLMSTASSNGMSHPLQRFGGQTHSGASLINSPPIPPRNSTSPASAQLWVRGRRL
jgi:hypothetical protein